MVRAVTRRWVRPDPVIKELLKLKLSASEAAKLATVMSRIAAGEIQARDLKPLRDGVEEVRVRVPRGALRLYFTRLDHDVVLLALHVHFKKKDNDRDAVDLAVTRRAKYLAQSWGH
jgi:putative component of toxin-antitoxin plasmid stabilization module